MSIYATTYRTRIYAFAYRDGICAIAYQVQIVVETQPRPQVRVGHQLPLGNQANFRIFRAPLAYEQEASSLERESRWYEKHREGD